MPANLSPEYKAAEAAFRATREPRERLECLREMLRTIPKHKGTEHLQADIKARIKDLGEQLESGRKSGGHGGPALVIRPEGAAQVALLGPPNSGKSALHARLTASGATVAPYPFTTQFPQPGMMPHEDIFFQLIDLPPLAAEHPVPWLGSTLQTADAALLVVDPAEPACTEQLQQVRSLLAARRVTLTGRWPAADESRGGEAQDAPADDPDPFGVRLPTLLLANKADLAGDADAELQALLDLTGIRLPALAISARTGRGLGELGPWLFARLGVLRVYTKVPGHAADRRRPFTLRRGQTVGDVARLVHRDLVRTLRYARIWGPSGFDGQTVGHEHRVADGDVVELHG
ncbi:MAG: TGS domain-containing protein [Burkholderiaceae bacterium]|jgi:ribosome-interacting GTPase 1|nr:TGS domain-containing protein [Burkholderiaceae bacterium]